MIHIDYQVHDKWQPRSMDITDDADRPTMHMAARPSMLMIILLQLIKTILRTENIYPYSLLYIYILAGESYF